MKKAIVNVLLTFIICTLSILFCTDWENPYVNANDSKVIFLPLSIHDGQTVSVFSRDSIGVQFYLREHLSSFSISIKGNRYWKDTTISSLYFDNNHKTFNFSFHDTGWHEIVLSFRRINGDTAASQIYRVYASSPLNQNTLEIKAGESITLSTPPVLEDVFYVWDLHSFTIKDYKPSVKYLIDKAPSSSVGEVYVIDRNDYRSPSSFFVIKSKKDSILIPRISIDNDSFVKDTVFSATPALQFVGNITGITTVKEFTINNIDVKTIKTNDSTYHFSCEFKNVDISSPVAVIVYIKSNLDSIVKDTFFIKYTESSTSITPVITIQNPSKETTTSNNQAISIYGQVSNYAKYPSGAVIYSNNGNTHTGFTKLIEGTFSIPVTLDPGVNKLVLKFIQDTASNISLADKEISVYFDSSSLDTTGPAIYVLYNNTDLADSTLFRVPSLPLSILIHDFSLIKNVTVNGTAAALSADSINHLPTFVSTFSLKHPNNVITIEAIDAFSNPSKKIFTSIRHNQLPVITGNFSATQGVAGTAVSWKTIVTDPDNDSLTVTATVNGHILTLSTDSSFKWVPSIADTGWHKVTIQAYDKYESVDTTFDINISNLIDAGIAVKWLTDSSAIPDTLILGEDTLQVELSANVLSNMRPFHYKAELTDVNKVLLDSDDGSLKWIPDSTNLGFHSIKFTITDSGNNKDVFTDNIVIVNSLPSVIQFTNASGNASEASGVISIPVSLSQTSNKPVTVEYKIDWTKTTADRADFDEPTIYQLTFNPGELTKSINLNILNNTAAEQDEKITLKLANPSSNATLGSQITTTFTIIDDDYAYFSFVTNQSSGSETANAVDSVFIEVTLSKALQTETTLNCNIADEYTTASTNTSYIDYEFPESSQKLLFPAGSVKDTVLLLINSNNHAEADEVVAMKLSSNTPYLREGNITLYKYTIDGVNSSAPFYIDQNYISVTESNIEKTVKISRTGVEPIGNNVTMYFSVIDSLTTATAGVDYQILTLNPLVFPKESYFGLPAQLSNSISIKILDDNTHEENEKVVIKINKISSYGYISGSDLIEIEIFDND